VELAARIPSRFKSHNRIGKYILRQVAQKHIDPSCLTMKKKGFSLPVGQWMQSILSELVQEKNKSLKKRDIFNDIFIDHLNRKLHRDKVNYYKLWFLVSLEMWLECFMD
jgi:asparagine synthase (glutamine-hydrolysing)